MGVMNTYHGYNNGYNNAMYNAHKNVGAHYTQQNTVILFYACFCLKMPYLMYTIHSLILNSRPKALYIMPK